MDSLNILILSSRDKQHFAGMANDIAKAMTNAGHNVTFYYDEILTSTKFKTTSNQNTKNLSRIRRKIRKINHLPRIQNGYIIQDGKTMFVPYEHFPGIKSKEVVKSLNDRNTRYDIVIVLFFQDLFSYETLRQIYIKYHCLIVICAIDMYVMTGGCYYFGDCEKFKQECHYCPMFQNNKESQAHRNHQYKKYVYKNSNIAVVMNSYMSYYATQSQMMPNDKIWIHSYTLDESVFCPLDTMDCRKQIGLSSNAEFVIMFRQRHLLRKGGYYLIESLKQFLSTLSTEQKQKVALLIVGERFDIDLGIETLQLGFVNQNKLILAYNAASIFLNASIDDAGPSMINQSQACGTPVVSFDIGTAIDVVITGVSGYRAKLKDSIDLSNGISSIFSMTKSNYLKLRNSTRELALKENSLNSFASKIETIYNYSITTDHRKCQIKDNYFKLREMILRDLV